jgi:hypothetical protein
MSVFATKWDFLFASVLIGVDRSTGVFSGSEPVPGQQMVCVWTSEQIATEALHVESWELRPITVRDLLAVLPRGIGVVVDPERATGMTASAAYVAQLKKYLAAFPAGSQVRVHEWDLDEAVRNVLLAAADDARVREVHAFAYTVDDSPALGCLAYVAEDGETAAVGTAFETALDASTDPEALGVATVTIVDLAGVPDELRSVLGDSGLLHRRRRPSRWRR